jgi:hypothetical protein
MNNLESRDRKGRGRGDEGRKNRKDSFWASLEEHSMDRMLYTRRVRPEQHTSASFSRFNRPACATQENLFLRRAVQGRPQAPHDPTICHHRPPWLDSQCQAQRMSESGWALRMFAEKQDPSVGQRVGCRVHPT